MKTQPSLSELSQSELRQVMADLGHGRYRADQIRVHAWRGTATGFHGATNLPGELRSVLASELRWKTLELIAATSADRGLTDKLLLRGDDGQEIEAVMIRHTGSSTTRSRQTVCVSSQVGCAIGCVFCATGQLGLRRNLTAGEIVDQVLEAARRWGSADLGPPTNVVYMGMGEPLQNYKEVVRSIRLLSEWGISPRRVVVSTSGLVPEMDQLAKEGLPIRLAISLHAATDEVRNRLVPLNRRYPIAELIAAGMRFSGRTGRRVSLEYVLIAGLNDGEQDAAELRRLAAGARAHVNLIPMNPIPESPLRAPSQDHCRQFAAAVGPRATIRFSRGDRATAACGQLRAAMESDKRRLDRTAERLGSLPLPV